MAASEAGQHHQYETNTPSDNLPLVLLHRIPQFDLSYKSWLPATQFRLLDPLDPSFSSTPSGQTLAQSARLLLCLGPSPLTQHTLDRYPSIECVVGFIAGLDHLDLSDCRRRGITVTNAGDAFSDDVADFSVALLLDVLGRVSASNRYVRAGLWPVKGDYPLGSKLGGKQIGIVGLGSIGSRIAARLEAFGSSIPDFPRLLVKPPGQRNSTRLNRRICFKVHRALKTTQEGYSTVRMLGLCALEKWNLGFQVKARRENLASIPSCSLERSTLVFLLLGSINEKRKKK